MTIPAITELEVLSFLDQLDAMPTGVDPFVVEPAPSPRECPPAGGVGSAAIVVAPPAAEPPLLRVAPPPPHPATGWYPDPSGRFAFRWWNSQGWHEGVFTNRRRFGRAAVQAVDPVPVVNDWPVPAPAPARVVAAVHKSSPVNPQRSLCGLPVVHVMEPPNCPACLAGRPH